jgi:hypothetical protein
MQATNGSTAQQSSDLYITDGDWNDWMYGALHRYPFTVELGGFDFYPGPEIIPVEQERNRLSSIFVAQMADCPPRIVHTSTPRTRACIDFESLRSRAQ